LDSRRYAISFAIGSLREVPSDFDIPPDLDEFVAGVFLPRGESDWLGRNKYPARVLLLTQREVVVVAHPTSGEPPAKLPLGLISSLERGWLLLVGWIAFTGACGRLKLPYNNRTHEPIDGFLRILLDRWLPPPSPGLQECGHNVAGMPLNMKFEHALAADLLPRETPLLQCFRPAARNTRRLAFLRKEAWSAGDLIVATSRRLIWITERSGGLYQPYGTVSHSVPLAYITDLHSKWEAGREHLEVGIGSGECWQIPASPSEDHVMREFAACLRRIL
jgi:hypothetical protein